MMVNQRGGVLTPEERTVHSSVLKGGRLHRLVLSEPLPPAATSSHPVLSSSPQRHPLLLQASLGVTVQAGLVDPVPVCLAPSVPSTTGALPTQDYNGAI